MMPVEKGRSMLSQKDWTVRKQHGKNMELCPLLPRSKAATYSYKNTFQLHG